MAQELICHEASARWMNTRVEKDILSTERKLVVKEKLLTGLQNVHVTDGYESGVTVKLDTQHAN